MSLTLAELVERAGVDVSIARELVRIGVTSGGEVFEDGDVQRLMMATAFLDAGFTIEQLASAVEARTIGFEFADALDLEPVAWAGSTVGELAVRLDESVERLRSIYGAFGLPLPTEETPLRAVEEQVLVALVEGWRVAGEESTLRAARIFGDGARRVSEGWVALFVETVSLPAMERSGSFEEYAQSALRPAAEVVELAPRLLRWLQLRHTSHAVLEANLRHFERDLVSRGLVAAPDRGHPVIAFADLVGFTRLTEAEGDAVAVATVAQFQTLAEAAAGRNGGRVVKLLGDGALLRFGDVASAASAMLGLALEVAKHGLGAAHLGMEQGPVLERDGDVFGGTVNVAARIAASAGSGELLLGPGAAKTLRGDLRFVITALGEREFRGIGAPVPVCRVESADR